MTHENRLKISNPQRISRILRRICQASLPLIVRGVGAAGVSVKGRAATIINSQTTQQQVLRISNVSERGIAHLVAAGKIQVEFVMMSTKVVFASSIVAREDQSILVAIPHFLVSIERRKNARYNCTDELRAFLNLSAWQPEVHDLVAPPFYMHHAAIAGFIGIADLSFGGLCGITRFPATTLAIKRGLIDDRAQIILPMMGSIDVSLEIRWIKRIKEHHKDAEGRDLYKKFYKFGAEFVTQTDQIKLSIRQFISQLSQAGAI